MKPVEDSRLKVRADGGRTTESEARRSTDGSSDYGLVSLQTSHHQIPLDPLSRRENRWKRLRRSVWTAGTLHSAPLPGHRPAVAHFVTLTYRGVDDWRPDHLSKAMHRFRMHCKRFGIPCRYLSVAELQKRGAVHYHLLVWLPQGVAMPHWDQPTNTPRGRVIAPFWSHGMTNTQVARAGVGYLMKYVSKLDGDSCFPKGIRIYSVGGLDHQSRAIRSWQNLPEWAKRSHGVGDLCRSRSRLVVKDTGELLPPMYQSRIAQGKLHLIQLRDLPDRWHDGPYSTVAFH